MNLEALKYWSPHLNKLRDLIEQIPNYEQYNIFELYDKFYEKYGFKPSIEMLIACRHYVNLRVYVKRIRAKVFDGKQERIIDEDGIYYIVRIDEKRRERIKRILEEKDLFRLYQAGVRLPTASIYNVYYLSDDNFRRIKERKLLKELYQREPEVLTYIFDNLIVSWYDRSVLSILPNPDIDDVEKVQILYVEDPILVQFVKSF
jgi:hypothetical protein